MSLPQKNSEDSDSQKEDSNFGPIDREKQKALEASLFSGKDKEKNAKRLFRILREKSLQSLFQSESHWELILGFLFFFGGLYFLFNFFVGK